MYELSSSLLGDAILVIFVVVGLKHDEFLMSYEANWSAG
jgi:hypothetical protein